jgi:16S rRNA (guanine527-N7)-methyltransferase
VSPELEIARRYADALRLPVPPNAYEQLQRYLEALLEWGKRVNLIGSVDARTVVVVHFCDAMAAVAIASPPSGGCLVDVGSGAGLPGIVIAALRPDLRVTLVEPRRKRVAFLEHVRTVVDVGYDVVMARAEDLIDDTRHRDRYDVAVERAVAPIARSVELVLPLVVGGGLAVFMKGSNAAQEVQRLEASSQVLHRLQGGVDGFRSYDLPGEQPRSRTIVLVRRVVDIPSPPLHE